MVNPALAMLLVVGLFAWMLFRPEATAPARIFLLIVAVILFGPLSIAVMDAEKSAFPWKFDHHLQLIDRTLGITAFQIARHLGARQRDLLFAVYESLGYWMIVWYGLNLHFRTGKPRALLLSYVVSYGLAPLFYLVAPGCGPRHAFGSAFPLDEPMVSPVLTLLDYWPNAIPSLHLASAVLLVHFSDENRFWRAFAWIYLAGTAAATLAFEHYVIDLVVAVPYACFAICLAEGRVRAALSNLLVVLAWLVSIRLGTPFLVKYPLLLQAAAVVTCFAGAIPSAQSSVAREVVCPAAR